VNNTSALGFNGIAEVVLMVNSAGWKSEIEPYIRDLEDGFSL
jgi:hypothetical protein